MLLTGTKATKSVGDTFENRYRYLPGFLAVIGALIAALPIAKDQFQGSAHTGPYEVMQLLAGFCLVLGAIFLRYRDANTAAPNQDNAIEGRRHAGIMVQVALLAVLVNIYEIESVAFYDFLLGLIVCGFAANSCLPQKWRPSVFLGLSLFGMVAVLGLVNGAIILTVGLVLIGICHAPLSLGLRIAAIGALSVGVGAVRVGWLESDRLMVVVPILGSIFMFRLVIYLHDLTNGLGPKDWATRLSYFFMLPNFVFPFFPVVDFNAWGRSRNSKDELEVYQRGAMWLLIGALHLLLYRLVNYYLAVDPTEVVGFGSFLYYIVMNFGLYLKISGLFHTILGCLYLFGFALPETHARFYLSFSFIEFWRRINIYWKDFMQKMIFNPTYMWLKKRQVPHLTSVVLAILAVFFITWALHAYQWFWLRGAVPITWPDILFWLILAVFLVIQTILEARPDVEGAVARISPAALLVLRTTATMFAVVFLWSMWSNETMSEWFALLAVGGLPLLALDAVWTGANVARSAAFVGLVFVTVSLALGFTFGLAPKGSHPKKLVLGLARPAYDFARKGSTVVLVAGVLLALQIPAVYMNFPRQMQIFIVDMGTQRLSSRDQAKLERGYYEQLTDVKMINSELWNLQNGRRPNWPLLEQTPAVDLLDSYLAFQLKPSIAIPHKGSTLSTNSLGMRDREYTVEKPEGVKRIVVVGDSRAMGEGVADNQTFENLIEDRLNAKGGPRVESLNLGVAGYDAFQKQMVLEERVAPFSPDVVIHVSHQNDLDLGRRLARYVGSPNIPYTYLSDAISASGSTKDMERVEIERRLKPFASQVVGASYRSFVAEARSMNAMPVWVFIPSTEHYPEPTPEGLELRRLASEAGFVVVDLYDIYNDTDVKRIWIAPWDYHPNALGHKMIAERLESALLENHEIRKALGF